jgi:very long chain acyl-CoA dehydrogenase
MGAALTGTMKGCIKGAIEHANTRTQFGDKLRNFAAIKGKFATMELKV